MLAIDKFSTGRFLSERSGELFGGMFLPFFGVDWSRISARAGRDGPFSVRKFVVKIYFECGK
jgi:hypothetical protein